MTLSSNDRDKIFSLYISALLPNNEYVIRENVDINDANDATNDDDGDSTKDDTTFDEFEDNNKAFVLPMEEWKMFERKILIAKKHIMDKVPFVGYMLSKLRIVPTTSVGTMAVDNHLNIFINPIFVNKELKISVDSQKGGGAQTFEKDDVAGVLYHEAMHIMNLTFHRKQHRDPTLWNYSTDYIMNRDIVQAGFTLPSLGLVPLMYNNRVYALSYKFLTQLQYESIGNLANERRTIDPKIIGFDISADVYDITNLTAEELYDLFEKEKEEEDSKQQSDVPIKVGDIVKDKASGTYGKVTKIDAQSGTAEITPMTRAEIEKEYLKRNNKA